MSDAKQSYHRIEERPDGHPVLRLQGDWTIDRAEDIVFPPEDRIQAVSAIDASSIGRMDSWGAFHLKELARLSGQAVHLNETQKKLFDFLPHDLPEVPERKHRSVAAKLFIPLGRTAHNAVGTFRAVFTFVGAIAVVFFRCFGPRGKFRFHAVVRHIEETGLQALPIIGLLAVLISMVISYQAATQLAKFGANIFTIDLTVISLLREMGVMMTAIMVAGRSGSAFAAEIGVMKLREEIDALKTIGMDPIEVLVLPRLIALVVTLPILTFLADIIGLAGGAVISQTLLDIPFDQYIDRVQGVATWTMFFAGMIKAPVFAVVITVIGTFQGMSVSGSAESVGKLTTVAVVQSIFVVIMIDALFSILFANLGI